MEQLPENWPLWAGLLVTIILQFRGEIAGLLRARTERSADREEHEQEIEEVHLNARLQNDAADQLRKSWKDEQHIEIIRSWQSFVQDRLLAEIAGQAVESRKLQTEIRGVRRATGRLTDIVASLLSTARRENGDLIVSISKEIEELLEPGSE